jgi:hypothetical protein
MECRTNPFAANAFIAACWLTRKAKPFYAHRKDLDNVVWLCFAGSMGVRRKINLRQMRRETAFAMLDAISLNDLAGCTLTRAACLATTTPVYVRAWIEERGHRDLLATPPSWRLRRSRRRSTFPRPK